MRLHRGLLSSPLMLLLWEQLIEIEDRVGRCGGGG